MLCFGEDYALTLQLVLEIKYTDLIPWHIKLDLLIRGHLTPCRQLELSIRYTQTIGNFQSPRFDLRSAQQGFAFPLARG